MLYLSCAPQSIAGIRLNIYNCYIVERTFKTSIRVVACIFFSYEFDCPVITQLRIMRQIQFQSKECPCRFKQSCKAKTKLLVILSVLLYWGDIVILCSFVLIIVDYLNSDYYFFLFLISSKRAFNFHWTFLISNQNHVRQALQSCLASSQVDARSTWEIAPSIISMQKKTLLKRSCLKRRKSW